MVLRAWYMGRKLYPMEQKTFLKKLLSRKVHFEAMGSSIIFADFRGYVNSFCFLHRAT